MIVFNKIILDDYVQEGHSGAVKPLNRWLKKVSDAQWQNHQDLKKTFPSADYVKDGRYVFNIGGNKYRLVAVVLFIEGILILRFIGTHAEYDKIKDCSEI